MVVTHNAVGSPTVIELNAISKADNRGQFICAASFGSMPFERTAPSRKPAALAEMEVKRLREEGGASAPP
jgi:hypothetical protein